MSPLDTQTAPDDLYATLKETKLVNTGKRSVEGGGVAGRGEGGDKREPTGE